MTMTRQDYLAIATAIRGELLPSPDRTRLTYRLADVLGSSNPRFNRIRFVEACDPIEDMRG